MSDTLDTKRSDQIGMTHQTVARLDLAKNLSGTTLYALEHFRYGCPDAKAQAMMTGKTPPPDFHCPLCLQEKTTALPRNYTTLITLLPICKWILGSTNATQSEVFPVS
jgi:hypothetical protein